MRPHSRRPHFDIPAAGMSAVTWEPAPNGASSVAAVRRVQLYPSRFSLSAVLKMKSRVGLCQGPRYFPSRQPFHGGLYHYGQAVGKGTRNPLGSAALED
ncbi:hypothetical protein NDU88_000108 [Pleurodeles waltl]|uniref:Uncharacterized protein n=1 Tax=Pleurodeles waltl TaxID=8319 RepID=A0AAV7S4B0_PLEWA|nr:hypothetical protein NDU88_000108 [Pleurodeles waltl]